MQITILSIDLDRLQKANPDFTETLFETYLNSHPLFGKINPTNYIINTNFLPLNPNNLKVMNQFRWLVQMTSMKAPILHIIKNKQNA